VAIISEEEKRNCCVDGPLIALHNLTAALELPVRTTNILKESWFDGIAVGIGLVFCIVEI
jgi:hypothetical protein